GDDLHHRAVGVDAVNALCGDFARLVPHVTRIGEVDPAVRVDGQVVGTVEALALPAVRQNPHFAVLLGDRDAAIAPGVGTLGGDEAALRVEVQAVGPAAWLAIN